MKLSKRGEYALRSMIDLGIAAKVGRRIVRVTELAETETLPVKFLEQVMQQLREAGYVASERGKFGGYRLARPAGGIVIGDVVRLIDGPLSPIGCVSQSAYASCNCPDEEHCGLRMLMLDVRNAVTNVLDRCTLGDVVEATTRKMIRDGVALPFSAPDRLPSRQRRRVAAVRRAGPDPAEGVVHQLAGDYAI